MKFGRLAALAVAGVVAAGVSVAAQAQKPAAPAAPAAQGARPRLVAPVRGLAQVAFTKPLVKRGKVGG